MELNNNPSQDDKSINFQILNEENTGYSPFSYKIKMVNNENNNQNIQNPNNQNFINNQFNLQGNQLYQNQFQECVVFLSQKK